MNEMRWITKSDISVFATISTYLSSLRQETAGLEEPSQTNTGQLKTTR